MGRLLQSRLPRPTRFPTTCRGVGLYTSRSGPQTSCERGGGGGRLDAVLALHGFSQTRGCQCEKPSTTWPRMLLGSLVMKQVLKRMPSSSLGACSDQVVRCVEHAPDLFNHLLRESWERQVVAVPGIEHSVPVKVGLCQGLFEPLVCIVISGAVYRAQRRDAASALSP